MARLLRYLSVSTSDEEPAVRCLYLSLKDKGCLERMAKVEA